MKLGKKLKFEKVDAGYWQSTVELSEATANEHQSLFSISYAASSYIAPEDRQKHYVVDYLDEPLKTFRYFRDAVQYAREIDFNEDLIK